jgi:hypothetical protein
MRNNPGRVAWIVLITAFTVFSILAVAVPWSIRWYVINATRAHEARVTCLEGTAVVEDPRHTAAIPVLKGETVSVPEGSVVIVDEAAEAELAFFDQSLVRVFPSTRVALLRMQAPRFSASPRAAQITLDMTGGRVLASTVLGRSAPIEFRIQTLQAYALLLEDGNYTVEASNARSEIIVQRGTAEVAGALATGSEVVALSSRQRTVVETGKAPLAPLKAERDLIANGDFSSPLSTGWSSFNDQGADGGEVDGTASLVVDEGRRAVRLHRTGGEFNHCETIIEQELNRDLPGPLTTLQVRATVKLVNQSLSGGGYLSSEYPLMIRIRYRDAYSENDWVHGFYYQNFSNNPTLYGQEIPQNKWYFFESENLVGLLPITPVRILWVRVYASGWSYESLISEVSLIVE